MKMDVTEKTGSSGNQGLHRPLGPGTSLADKSATPLGAGAVIVGSSGELNHVLATEADDSFSSSSLSEIKANKVIANGDPN